MDMSNWRGPQSGSAAVGDSSMESGHWRAQLQQDSLQRMVNKIMDTSKRHLPFSGHEGLQELRKIAVRFEVKIYTAATSQGFGIQGPAFSSDEVCQHCRVQKQQKL